MSPPVTPVQPSLLPPIHNQSQSSHFPIHTIEHISENQSNTMSLSSSRQQLESESESNTPESSTNNQENGNNNWSELEICEETKTILQTGGPSKNAVSILMEFAMKQKLNVLPEFTDVPTENG